MGLRGPKNEQENKALGLGLVVKERPAPPRGMPKIAKALWRQIVGSLPVNHFHQSDLPLLTKYCMAEEVYWKAMDKALEGDLAIVTDKGYSLPDIYLTIANKQVQLQTALATKLRITVNSRVSNHKAAGEKETPQSKRKGLMFGGSASE